MSAHYIPQTFNPLTNLFDNLKRMEVSFQLDDEVIAGSETYFDTIHKSLYNKCIQMLKVRCATNTFSRNLTLLTSNILVRLY